MLAVLERHRLPISVAVGITAGLCSYLRQAASLSLRPPRSWRGELHSPLSFHDARLVLNASLFSTDAEITKNHRLLLAKSHPDRGGSKYIASVIGEAHAKLKNRS